MGENGLNFDSAKLSVVLAGIGSAALVVTIYHCLVMRWCHLYRGSRGRGARQQGQDIQHTLGNQMLEIASFENSTAQLIPAHKYQKGTGSVDDDGMCPVCLSQFEEGEELRTLPECLHSYHAPCIDMWLYSHSSCPMCRADATPLPEIVHHHRSDSGSIPLDSGSRSLESSMLHNMLQSLIL